MKTGWIPVIFILLTRACSGPEKVTKASPALVFLDEYVIPHRYPFNNTTVGGLSGIDYDPSGDLFYLISDDRSSFQPSRFYKALIRFRSDRIDTVEFISVHFLRRPDGNYFPSWKSLPSEAVDPEAIRFLPPGHIVWSSEGDRYAAGGMAVLNDPGIFISDTSGNFVATFQLPEKLRMKMEEGPRQNGALEALAFSFDGKLLYAALENPLLQDGPDPGVGDSAGWSRIIRFDPASRKPVAEFAYPLDPVVHRPATPGGFRKNGITEILAAGPGELLVVERSWSEGQLSSNIRVYLASLEGAEDISGIPSLAETPVIPVAKRLLLNMDTLPVRVDNIEGVTFGPRSPNGNKLLVFVSDDDFQAGRKTQLLLFEYK